MIKKICIAGTLLISMCASLTTHAARPSYTVLLQEINDLKARVSALESKPTTPLVKAYIGNTFLGYSSISDIPQGASSYLYEPQSAYFYWLAESTSDGVTTLYIRQYDVEYESFDCTGVGAVHTGGASDTRNILISNGADYFRTTGTYTAPQPRAINSYRDKYDGTCNGTTNTRSNEGMSTVDIVTYPLPYSLPMTTSYPYGIRMEYAEP